MSHCRSVVQFPALIILMTFESSCHRRRLHPLLARCLGVFAVAVYFFGGTSTVEASIVGPPAPQFCLESSSTGTGATRSGKTRTPSDHQIPEESVKHRALTLLTAPHSPSGTSSTSGTSLLAGASAAAALGHVPANFLCDPAVAGWLSGERRVALPMPTGNDLLRPPQAA